MRAGLAPLALAAAATATLGGAGCFSSASDEPCRSDRECGELVCTRVGECVASAGVYALRVEWTIDGRTTDQAGACDRIAELELTISDPTTGDQHGLAPVPCLPGSFFYDKLPLGYTAVRLAAYGPGGGFLDSAVGSAVGSGGLVRLDLRP